LSPSLLHHSKLQLNTLLFYDFECLQTSFNGLQSIIRYLNHHSWSQIADQPNGLYYIANVLKLVSLNSCNKKSRVLKLCSAKSANIYSLRMSRVVCGTDLPLITPWSLAQQVCDGIDCVLIISWYVTAQILPVYKPEGHYPAKRSGRGVAADSFLRKRPYSESAANADILQSLHFKRKSMLTTITLAVWQPRLVRECGTSIEGVTSR